MEVREMSVKYIRDNLAATIDEVAEKNNRIAITRFGRVKAFLVPVMSINKSVLRKKTNKKYLK